jgi:signal transduction histidine kinase
MQLKALLHSFRSHILTRPISLRLLVGLGVSLPIFLLLTLLSLFHYWQEYHLLEEQERFSATQLGSLLSHSLSHSLRNKDGTALIAAFSQIGRSENVVGMQIIGESGHILFASDMSLSSSLTDTSNVGCWACHQSQAAVRPRTVELGGNIQVMRIATPIRNDVECNQCHDPGNPALGVLILDISLEELQSITLTNLGRDMGISAVATLLMTICTFYLINFFVVRRIEVFRKPMSAYAAGDFSVRISEGMKLKDEINGLANTFNHMADQLTRQSREQEDRSKLRQHAIIEERERIGRELHDGLAQVLGYVTNKAVAVRLMLEKRSLEEADNNLFQLENAARGLLADMREDILGLKTASQVDSNLSAVLRDYLQRYNTLVDRPVEFSFPQDDEVRLEPGIVLQLTRIVQEALANVRKHSNATRVNLNLRREGQALVLEVKDNGRGFDTAAALDGRTGRFGLSTMQERAEEIGAVLSIHSQPGFGTAVRVRLEPVQRSDQ